MGITKLENQNLNDDAITSSNTSGMSVDSSKINSAITNDDISPSASLATTKLDLSSVPSSQFVQMNSSGGTIDIQGLDESTFNIGLLGFKMAVTEGLTIFNLKDGIVDEFNDESGIDTAENVNVTYDSSSDFYSGGFGIGDSPPTEGITAFTSVGPHTYNVETGTTNVNVLIVGGGGGGGSGGYNRTKGGGAGAGGLIYYPNYPVTPGGTVAVTVGAGGEGGGYYPSPGSTPYTPTARPDGRVGTGEFGGYEHPQYTYPPNRTYYTPGQTGTDSSFGPLIGEGGGAGGGYLTAGSHPYMGGLTGPQYHSGGSGGAAGGSGSGYTPGSAGETSTQVGNHPIPLTPTVLPENSPGSFGNDGGVNQTDSAPTFGASGGGGAGGAGGDAEGTVAGEGGIGLNYNIADGTTSVGYAGGGAGAADGDFPQGTSVPFGGGDTNPSPHQSGPFFPGLPGAVNSGGGGAGGRNTPPYPQPVGGAYGGDGGPGVVIVKEVQGQVNNTSTTLISDTFTANSIPTTARIVVFAEINSTLNSQLSASATRDNTTFNAITLTDSGYVTGSSGVKIFTGSTPLTGSASPQVQLRWKITGSSLTGANKIHGVSLQWA